MYYSRQSIDAWEMSVVKSETSHHDKLTILDPHGLPMLKHMCILGAGELKLLKIYIITVSRE